MRYVLPLACSLAALLGPLAAHPTEARGWTDQKGRTLQGSFLSATETTVEIRRTDGKFFSIPRATLSKEDNDYIDSRRATQAEDSKTHRHPMLAGYDPSVTNFHEPWPDRVGYEGDAPITVIEESPEANRYIYESPHFRFQSNVILRPSLIAKVATMFEASYELHRQVPFNNRRTRSPDAGKFKAKLFETLDQYYAAGGAPGSTGYYFGRTDEFILPLTSLGVKKVGSGYMFDHTGNNHVFFHEITHQLWADIGECAGSWMVEGFAEFMGCAPYRNGRFSLIQQPSHALEYATGYGKDNQGGRALGKEIQMPRLETLMTMSQAELYQNPNVNYGYGLLLVYYFIYLDGENDAARFKDCIRALQEGKDAAAARAVLLGGRTWEQLEADVSAGFRPKGIRIRF
ncbi:MAG: hypothetical protein QM627_02300 [Luteolibacter sp.]